MDVIDLQLDADVSEWATANPRQYDYFDPNEPKYRQIPVDPEYEAMKDRFDVIIGMEECGHSTEEKEDVARHILRRGTDDYDQDVPFGPDALVKFVSEANQNDPETTEEAEELVFDAYFSLKQEGSHTERLITNRTLVSLKKLAIAFARADLSESVEREHAQQAFDFFKRALESIDFEIGKDSFSEESSRHRSEMEKVKAAVEDITERRDDGAAPIEAVADEAGMSIDRVEQVLNDGSNEGVFYEPKSGRWAIP